MITNINPEDKYCRFHPLLRQYSIPKNNSSADQYKNLYTNHIQPLQEHIEDLFLYPTSVLEDIKGDGEYVKWVCDNRDWTRKRLERCGDDDSSAMSIEIFRLGDLNINDGLQAINEKPDLIIERLPIQNVLSVSKDYLPYDENGHKVRITTRKTHPQLISSQDLFKAIETNKEILPKAFTDRLYYEYDFGDSWRFQITGSRGCSDLVENKIITWKKMMDTVNKVIVERHPVLIAADGDMLIEDVGGIHGFVEFLERMKFKPDAFIRKQTNEKFINKAQDYGADNVSCKNTFSNIIQDEVISEEGNLFTEGVDNNYENNDHDENEMTKSDLLLWALSQGWCRSNSDIIDLL